MKNIAPLHGKPLISYSIESALKSIVDRVIVSTDSEKIAKVAMDYKAEVIMRPSELAKDDTPTLPVIQHAIESCGEKFKYVVTLQPTSPLRTNKHINKAFIQLAKSKLINCASFCKVKNKVLKTFIVKNKKIKPAFSKRIFTANSEQLPETYIPNGAIYIFTIKEFLKKKKIPQTNIYPFIMSSTASVDIDNFDDFLFAKKNFKKCFIEA